MESFLKTVRETVNPATHRAGIRYLVPFKLPGGRDLPPRHVTDEQNL